MGGHTPDTAIPLAILSHRSPIAKSPVDSLREFLHNCKQFNTSTIHLYTSSPPFIPGDDAGHRSRMGLKKMA